MQHITQTFSYITFSPVQFSILIYFKRHFVICVKKFRSTFLFSVPTQRQFVKHRTNLSVEHQICGWSTRFYYLDSVLLCTLVRTLSYFHLQKFTLWSFFRLSWIYRRIFLLNLGWYGGANTCSIWTDLQDLLNFFAENCVPLSDTIVPGLHYEWTVMPRSQ